MERVEKLKIFLRNIIFFCMCRLKEINTVVRAVIF